MRMFGHPQSVVQNREILTGDLSSQCSTAQRPSLYIEGRKSLAAHLYRSPNVFRDADLAQTGKHGRQESGPSELKTRFTKYYYQGVGQSQQCQIGQNSI